MKVYVKKVWSDNPKLTRSMELGEALRLYDIYLDYFREGKRPGYKFKSFKEWLSTEI